MNDKQVIVGDIHRVELKIDDDETLKNNAEM